MEPESLVDRVYEAAAVPELWPDVLALLTVMGCDMVQGYLISRPIGFEALCRFLDEQAHQAVIARTTPLSLGRLVAHARA